LRTAVQAVAEGQWEAYGKPDAEVIRECADVLFVPNEHREHKDLLPVRYVAVRIRRRQGGLLEEAVEDKHFAVLTNIRAWKASRLLAWQREKAGTIEHVHDEVKNGLGGGHMPSQHFAVNAAWFKMARSKTMRRRSRSDRSLPFSSSAGTLGGGVGTCAPITFSSTHTPRCTGEVRSGFEVTMRKLPWPSSPRRASFVIATRRNWLP